MSDQPAGVTVLKMTVATILFSMLARCLGSTGGFQLDQVGLTSQIRIDETQPSLHVLCALWLPELYFW